MAVKFLSEEWARAVTDALNGSEAFRQAAGTHSARLQQVVSTPEGEVRYYMKLEDGKAEVALGEIEGADATIGQDYATAASISRGEVNLPAAFMTGRLRVSGNMMKLMQLQAVGTAISQAIRDVEVDY